MGWGWDWDHQTYSHREGYGSLGIVSSLVFFEKKKYTSKMGVKSSSIKKCVLKNL